MSFQCDIEPGLGRPAGDHGVEKGTVGLDVGADGEADLVVGQRRASTHVGDGQARTSVPSLVSTWSGPRTRRPTTPCPGGRRPRAGASNPGSNVVPDARELCFEPPGEGERDGSHVLNGTVAGMIGRPGPTEATSPKQ